MILVGGEGDVESTCEIARNFAGGAEGISVDRTLMIPVDAGGCEEYLAVARSLGSAAFDLNVDAWTSAEV